jgi:predicted N-formylglutamate amidohydrolase
MDVVSTLRDEGRRLLAPDEPESVRVERAGGRSPFLLTCDHAGHLLPRALGDLGVAEPDLLTHIGWDIGALGVALRLSALLDATLVAQTYSRLAIDCNRVLGTAASIPVRSERTEVPGNRDLDDDARRARERDIHEPYHDAIAALLDARASAGRPTLLLAVHSFTPIYDGVPRPWHVALSNDDYRPLAEVMIALLREDPDLVVGDNEPYSIEDVDYTIPVHGGRRGLPRAMLEIRHDRIATEAGQEEWANRIAGVLRRVELPLPAAAPGGGAAR